jgi:hypothetical protein
VTDPTALPAELARPLRETLMSCARGDTPPSVTAMNILMELASEAEVWETIRQIEAWMSGSRRGKRCPAWGRPWR